MVQCSLVLAGTAWPPAWHCAMLPKHAGRLLFSLLLASLAVGQMADVPLMSKSTCGSIPSLPKRGYHPSASWSPLVLTSPCS